MYFSTGTALLGWAALDPNQDIRNKIYEIRNTIYEIREERWLNGSAPPDCKSVVLGSNPTPPQHTANSTSPEVGSHLG